MALSSLGFDGWFADRMREQCGSGQSVARVIAVDRARYLIRDEFGDVPAELSGRLRFVTESSAELPCVGDWVCATCRDARTHGSIHAVLPRKTFLRRKAAGRDIEFQMIAANIDVAFVVQSCHFDFNVRRLERYLVMVREGQIEPVLLLTKVDLVGVDELALLVDKVRRAGIGANVIPVSNSTGAGVDRVRELLVPGKTYCLLGSSAPRESGRRRSSIASPETRDWRRETSAIPVRVGIRQHVASWSCSRVAPS